MADAAPKDLTDGHLYINRELSWLAFNARVLEEAREPTLPLYERLKFLGIFVSNLDEFFMVRVAGLRQQLLGGVKDTQADRMLPAEQLTAISAQAHQLVAEHSLIWNEQLLPELAERAVRILPATALTNEQAEAGRQYFLDKVFPVLTPLAVDPGHPFPHLRNKSINLALMVGRGTSRRRRRAPEHALAVVQVPSIFSRLVPVPENDGACFMLLEDLIEQHAAELFPGYAVIRSARFRVTRNWDMLIDEEDSEDLLSTVQEELLRRDRGAAVRLEINIEAPEDLERMLRESLHIEQSDVFRVSAPLQLYDLNELAQLDGRPELHVEPFTPIVPKAFSDGTPLIEAIAKGDILLHHPYESFEPVVRFLEEAAEDPDVLAIKQTLYRTSADFPIVRALSRAAQNGKQVAALVEIKARFDEARNINWARHLEESGVHVVYGLVGLKTHCKVALVVRREPEGIRRYVHLGTGNYNPESARAYTDLSLFTARREIGDDATALFNVLTGFASASKWKRLSVAPFSLYETIVSLIRREMQYAQRGEPARIRAKMNALVDASIIRALYEASQAGVEIDLLVRGICCLRPGVPGVSEHIRVKSIVDRFLEHSRIFAFGPDDRAEVFLSSADWMPRNLFKRVEVMFPVEDVALRRRILQEVLGLAFKDTAKSRQLLADGTYAMVPSADTPLRSQAVLLETARRSVETPGSAVKLRGTGWGEDPFPS